MKAKFINEEIKHLSPRDKSDIKKQFEEKYDFMSFETFEKYLKELKNLGVEVVSGYSYLYHENFNSIEVKSFEVYEQSWNVAKCLRKEDADAIIAAHLQYAFSDRNFKIKESKEYISINNIENVVHKLKASSNVKYSKYKGEKASDLNNKWNEPGYKEWYVENILRKK
jgi:hypothetical protein